MSWKYRLDDLHVLLRHRPQQYLARWSAAVRRVAARKSLVARGWWPSFHRAFIPPAYRR